MTGSNSGYAERVEKVAANVAAHHAAEVDAKGAFPRESVDAMARAGLFGLMSAREVGGMGETPAAAVRVIERLAQECGSTAMVMSMHFSGAAVIEKLGPESVRREIAAGKHLSTLAFSESGSRSHFWAPMSTAAAVNGSIRLDAQKSWITSARQADAYVWSSRPVAAEGASTLWLVPSKSAGLQIPARFDGLGLRGNDSSPVSANHVEIPESNRLGADGGGFDVMMGVVLPNFQLMNSACSLGLMEAATQRTAAHAAKTRYEHLGSSLADSPTTRAYIARMRIKTDMARALVYDAADAVERGRDDAMLRVLESKAAAAETALEVTALAMRVCGGAAFRKEVGVERIFRDAQAASVMAPTTDVLYDFIGKAVCGLPLF